MIFDANVFLGAWPFHLTPTQTVASLRGEMRSAGVARAAVSPLSAVFQPEPSAANRELFGALHRTPSLVPVPVVNPRLANWRDQLDACLAERTVTTVRLLPNYHDYDPVRKALRPFFDAVAEAGLKIVLTARMEDDRHRYFALGIKGVPLATIEGFLQSYPTLPVLLTGVAVGEINHLLPRFARVSAELSYAEHLFLAAQFRGRALTSRLMFGSMSPLVSLAAQVAKVVDGTFRATELRRVRHTNASAFFDQRS